MSKKEMIERSRRALEEFDRLPPEQQVRELVRFGTINEQGEVLLGRNGQGAEEESAQEDRRGRE
jgi:hypothetical protein